MNINQVKIEGTYFERYSKLVKDSNLIEALENQLQTFLDFLHNIPTEKQEYAYAPEKWTTKQMLQHIIDTERIFSYRSLAFARKETQALPGFDENQYNDNAYLTNVSFQDLITDFELVRKSNISLFKTFANDAVMFKGTASNFSINALELGFVMVGHVIHHMQVYKERYQ
jgi:hypothetical protein